MGCMTKVIARAHNGEEGMYVLHVPSKIHNRNYKIDSRVLISAVASGIHMCLMYITVQFYGVPTVVT